LQEGYMVGFLFAALAYYVVFAAAGALGLEQWNWRILFVVGVLPALLIFYIRANVPESPAWIAATQARARRRVALTSGDFLRPLLRHWPLVLYAIAFMAAFNFMSHGTQDLYPTFLQKQHGFGPRNVFLISLVAAVGAIAGGVTFGALSQRYGRRACVLVCAVLGAVVIPLWAFSQTIVLLAVGAFCIQFMVQGAWGVIPAHLNELSPATTRGTFPGVAYQLGNLFAAGAAQIQAALAVRFSMPSGGGANFGKAMAISVLVVFVGVFVLTLVGYRVKAEGRDRDFLAIGDP
jgi:SHS family lactate transporter-like MFS transporter